MVNALVGPEKFREGLQLYMRRHAYGNTETHDLWQSWSEVSGINVAEVMATWTTRLGYPYVRVVSESWSGSQVEITLEQSWFLADGSVGEPLDGETAVPLWQIPLVFSTPTMTSQQAVLMKDKVQTFVIPLVTTEAFPAEKQWLRINAGQKALVRVALSESMTQRLLPALAHKQLSPVDRAACLLDAYALAKANKAPIEGVVNILRGFQSEDSSVVWDGIAGVLNGLYLLLEAHAQSTGDSSGFIRFLDFGKQLVLSAFSRVGWDVKPTDGHTDGLLRATLIGLLDTFAWNDAGIVAECRRRFDGHWETPSLLPSEYRATVYKIILKNGGVAEYEAILKTFYATEDNAEKRFAFSLGAADSVRYL